MFKENQPHCNSKQQQLVMHSNSPKRSGQHFAQNILLNSHLHCTPFKNLKQCFQLCLYICLFFTLKDVDSHQKLATLNLCKQSNVLFNSVSQTSSTPSQTYVAFDAQICKVVKMFILILIEHNIGTFVETTATSLTTE